MHSLKLLGLFVLIGVVSCGKVEFLGDNDILQGSNDLSSSHKINGIIQPEFVKGIIKIKNEGQKVIKFFVKLVF